MRKPAALAIGLCALAAALTGGGCRSREQQAQAPISESGRWFVEKGCAGCHTVTSLGVGDRPAPVAPDLSNAVRDVPARYGVSLEEFLTSPPGGMMSVVLAGQIPLTPEERATAVERLEEALREFERRAASPGAARPAPAVK